MFLIITLGKRSQLIYGGRTLGLHDRAKAWRMIEYPNGNIFLKLHVWAETFFFSASITAIGWGVCFHLLHVAYYLDWTIANAFLGKLPMPNSNFPFVPDGPWSQLIYILHPIKSLIQEVGFYTHIPYHHTVRKMLIRHLRILSKGFRTSSWTILRQRSNRIWYCVRSSCKFYPEICRSECES